MIKELVDILSGLIQLLLGVGLIIGGYLGVKWPEYSPSGEFADVDAFWRFVIGSLVVFILEAIFVGPFLIVLDIRNAVRDKDQTMSSLLKAVQQLGQKAT